MKPPYVPAAGHLVWINFDPQFGREQAGRRPALVLSASLYNRRSTLLVCCPITSRSKNYSFEVPMPPASKENGGITGFVLADHLKSMDWQERDAAYAGQAAAEVIEDVKLMVAVLLQIPEGSTLF